MFTTFHDPRELTLGHPIVLIEAMPWDRMLAIPIRREGVHAIRTILVGNGAETVANASQLSTPTSRIKTPEMLLVPVSYCGNRPWACIKSLRVQAVRTTTDCRDVNSGNALYMYPK
jgi:hypothetical protein